jgi:DNA-binding response OmpR family regulator
VNILIVADDGEPATARLVAAFLDRGHIVSSAGSVGEAELAYRLTRFDVVIALDPAATRDRVRGAPVAGWSPGASSAAAAVLIEEGADEALHGGMVERELVARVDALTRRAPAPGTVAELGPLQVDDERGVATWRGRRLALTARERRVLRVLAAAGGDVVRRDRLYREVWGYAMARGDRTVDVNVKRLRDKLADAVGAPLTIETEVGVGYRLVVAEDAVTAL